MRTAQRLVLVAAVVAMFSGVAALAVDPVPLDTGWCKLQGRGQDQERGQSRHCDPICGPCERVVCDGMGQCKFHCEPIPDCTPV